MALATFLVEATEARVELFEPGERSQRRWNIAEPALCYRVQIQDIAVLRNLRQQGPGAAKRIGEPPLRHEAA